MSREALAALRGQVARTSELAAGFTADEWAAASDCAGWRVQDVVCHLACTFQQVADPGSIPGSPDGDAERTAADAVDARRSWSSAQVLDAYDQWSGKGLAALEPLQEEPAATVVIPLGNLGSHPLHLLANAYAFDHYCHLHHDVLRPGGPVERSLADDEDVLDAALGWMLAGIPQMNASALGVLDRPLNFVTTGPDRSFVFRPGALISIDTGRADDAAATVTTSARDFVRWGTKRVDWRPLVTVAGDADYAAAVLDVVKVI
jgi:uncharacterized protein (TIGR03083 family)